MDDDKFGVCGLIWIVSMFLFISAFKEWGFPIWLTVVLSPSEKYTPTLNKNNVGAIFFVILND